MHTHPLKLTPCANNSYFISFEGIEGAGKSTQITAVKNWAENRGYDVLLVREPGGTEFGEGLRQAILASNTPLHPIAEATLFCSSRAQLLHEKILPHLIKPNSWVICDRYLDSSLVYQGVARKLGMDTILDLHKYEPLCFAPHATFYLKISLETSLKRQLERGQEKDYFEKEKSDFYKELIHGYDLLSQRFNERYQVIDGEQDSKIITESIIDRLEGLF